MRNAKRIDNGFRLTRLFFRQEITRSRHIVCRFLSSMCNPVNIPVLVKDRNNRKFHKYNKRYNNWIVFKTNLHVYFSTAISNF